MNQETQEQTSEEVQTAARKQLERALSQMGGDMDRYLLYMTMVLVLETFLRTDENGTLKTKRKDVENVITNWTENFRGAVQSLIDKDPEETQQLSSTALNAVVNSTRKKLFKIITVPPEEETKEPVKETK